VVVPNDLADLDHEPADPVEHPLADQAVI